YALLGGTLLMVGIITLARALVLTGLIEERDDFEIKHRHKVAAVSIGACTGLVIGVTSAGSGTVIAILLIAIFRLSPQRVVGTDVFHAAILLWAAGMAHWVSGNVDFGLAGNILLGSIPGVIVGAHFATRAPSGFLRTSLGVVLVASGIITVQKGDPVVWPIAAAVAGISLALLIYAPRWYAKRRRRDLAAEERQRRRERMAAEPAR
ncbi:MAG: sulfite exporter TauE/SafE family protein, partial [Solirubrobacterales bacterium]